VKDGLEQTLPKMKELVDKGFSIALYPEGTRSENCDIARFHQGAFYIADQLGVGIMPMCIYGTGKVLPKKMFSLHKGPIYIEVDKPIYNEQLKQIGEYRQQASYMRKYYIKKYESIANRIEQDV
jgi:1-acyl-sn-glycerol-3-phosphate acyltransferase